MIENFWQIRDFLEQHQVSLTILGVAILGFSVLFFFSMREILSWYLRINKLQKDITNLRTEILELKNIILNAKNTSPVVTQKTSENLEIKEDKKLFSIENKKATEPVASSKKDLFVFSSDNDKTL